MFTPMIGFILFLWSSILLSLSSNSSFMMWMSLEMNMLGFLPLMSFNGNKMLENTMKYFLIQGISSSVFLMFSMLSMLFYSDLFDLVLLMSLMVKLGTSPFHMWFISLMGVVSLNTLFILSTIQKLIPLIIMSTLNFSTVFLYIFVFLNSITIFYSGSVSKNLNSVLAFSSINNLSWMFVSVATNFSMTIFYFLIYLFLMIGVLILFWSPSNCVPTQMVMSSLGYGVMSLFTMFSLAGLPPLMGFLGKLFMVKQMFDPTLITLFVILMFSSLFILLFYMGFTYSGVTMVPYNKQFQKPKNMSSMMCTYTSVLLGFNLFSFLMPYVS